MACKLHHPDTFRSNTAGPPLRPAALQVTCALPPPPPLREMSVCAQAEDSEGVEGPGGPIEDEDAYDYLKHFLPSTGEETPGVQPRRPTQHAWMHDNLSACLADGPAHHLPSLFPNPCCNAAHSGMHAPGFAACTVRFGSAALDPLPQLTHWSRALSPHGSCTLQAPET